MSSVRRPMRSNTTVTIHTVISRHRVIGRRTMIWIDTTTWNRSIVQFIRKSPSTMIHRRISHDQAIHKTMIIPHARVDLLLHHRHPMITWDHTNRHMTLVSRRSAIGRRNQNNSHHRTTIWTENVNRHRRQITNHKNHLNHSPSFRTQSIRMPAHGQLTAVITVVLSTIIINHKIFGDYQTKTSAKMSTSIISVWATVQR